MGTRLFTAAGQKRLRDLLGTLVPAAKAGHVAEAIAAGWNFRNHAALLDAMDSGLLEQEEFEATRCLKRLAELGTRLAEDQATAVSNLLWAATRHLKGGGADSHRPPPQDPAAALRLALICEESGLIEAAAKTAAAAMVLGDQTQRAEAFALFERLSSASPTALLNKGVALANGHGAQRNPQAAMEILRDFVRHEDDEMAMAANAVLASLLHQRGGPGPSRDAIAHWERAAELGEAASAFNVGLAYQHGTMGVRVDKEKATRFYRISAAGGHAHGMTNLALMLQRDDPDRSVHLLEAAASLGDDHAKTILEMTERMGGSGRSFWEQVSASERLSAAPRVARHVPDGMKRPLLVASAIVRGLHFTRANAEELTAMLYGFRSWPELQKATEAGPADPTDEACDAETASARRASHIRLLETATSFDGAEARAAARLLAPTSGKGKPSLRRLAEAAKEERRDEGEEEDFSFKEALGDFMRRAGVDPTGDPLSVLDQMRTMHPIQPDVWLAFLDEICGWSIAEANPDAEGDGARVGFAIASGNRRFPIFMSSIAYIPGDTADAQEKKVKAQIARSNATAILLFNKPLHWEAGKGAEARGVLYGGQILLEGRWDHFVLRQRHGLDDVLEQRGHLSGQPSEDFLARFGCRASESEGMAVSLAAYLAGREPGQGPFHSLRTASGWMQAMA